MKKETGGPFCNVPHPGIRPLRVEVTIPLVKDGEVAGQWAGGIVIDDVIRSAPDAESSIEKLIVKEFENGNRDLAINAANEYIETNARDYTISFIEVEDYCGTTIRFYDRGRADVFERMSQVIDHLDGGMM